MRWAVLGLVLVLAARPWIPSSLFLLSWPYDLAGAAVDFPTVFIASDECLAARLTHLGVSSFVGEPAQDELEHRGAAAVPGMARVLSQQLDRDALRPGFFNRHQSEFKAEATVYSVYQRAQSGASFLITQIAKYGGAQPVLETWAEQAPTPGLRAKAAMALECVQLKRQSMLNVYSASCAAPGEVCTAGRCSKIFGESCHGGIECFSNTCAAGRCCQPLGEACTGTECCGLGSCTAGRCAISPPASGTR
ncbi:MAG: hypothetical protein ABW061_17180 [Polyangiaceae bacterium]